MWRPWPALGRSATEKKLPDTLPTPLPAVRPFITLYWELRFSRLWLRKIFNVYGIQRLVLQQKFTGISEEFYRCCTFSCKVSKFLPEDIFVSYLVEFLYYGTQRFNNNNNNNNNNNLALMELGHLLTHFSLTHPEISSMASPVSFCLGLQFFNSSYSQQPTTFRCVPRITQSDYQLRLVCLSVCNFTDFHDFLCFSFFFFLKLVMKIQVSLKSCKNIGYFMFIGPCIIVIVEE